MKPWCHRALVIASLISMAIGLVAWPVLAEKPEAPAIKDTQKEDIPRLSPEEALAKIETPPGYKVTLFAAEPMIRQPMDIAFDARDRAWVVENDTFAEVPVRFDMTQSDRIVILEDVDHDGKADKRTVFMDGMKRLTSVELGFGGVWALAPPYVYFIPDRNGDDQPDGEPEIVLDGWDVASAGHNITNGLKWGPDGWLYGRNGILATSTPGVPGTPAEDRPRFNCGLWRYHPTEKRFEVVCRGGTNSWGHDWDENGELFFINTVIGHLWHVIPGAHFRRMYGEDANPHTYELIEQTADHVHWDTKEQWHDIRKIGVSPTTDAAGGGHAHSGFMIYQGDNWPAELRGKAITVNYHGRRLNVDSLDREGATFVGHHRPDMIKFGDEWFRGVELDYGLDGGVYVLDWNDIGECHDNDGIHRTAGRIFKVTYGEANTIARDSLETILKELSKDTETALAGSAKLLGNERLVRSLRLALQERHGSGGDVSKARSLMQNVLDASLTKQSLGQEAESPLIKILSGMHVSGGIPAKTYAHCFANPRLDRVRAAAVRFAIDGRSVSSNTAAALTEVARSEKSGLVLCHLAGALQRLEPSDRWALAKVLLSKKDFSDDRVYPLMIWYGIEEIVGADPARATELLGLSPNEKLDTFIARRIASETQSRPEGVAALTKALANEKLAKRRGAILAGVQRALQGWRKAAKPEGWDAVAALVEKSGDENQQRLAREISIVFGDGRAADELKAIVADGKRSFDERRQAIESLASSSQTEGLAELLLPLLTDRDLGAFAVRAFSRINPPKLADELLGRFGGMPVVARDAAVEALATRPATAARLLAAVEKNEISPEQVPAFAQRQLQLLGDAALSETIYRIWPSARRIEGDRVKQAEALRAKTTPDLLAKADLGAGKAIYAKNCGKCHKLFGEGQNIGPELTGAQRGNLNYWLENIVDPSAQVADKFRVSKVVMKDGRQLVGVVVTRTERTLTLQTATEKLDVDTGDVEEVEPSTLSLMPENQLTQMSDAEVRDLFGYLMSGTSPAP